MAFKPQRKSPSTARSRRFGDPLAEIAAEFSQFGAHEYVLKADASRELLPAIDAVLSAQRFVGSGLTGRDAGLVDCIQPDIGQAPEESDDQRM